TCTQAEARGKGKLGCPENCKSVRCYEGKLLYMSSEESEVDETTKRIMRYNIQLVRSRIVPREGGQPSIRPKPNDFPEWAAKNEDDNVVDESAHSLSLVALR
ncbi:Hypothetical predicted protein, partial [Paramuricea clavata]